MSLFSRFVNGRPGSHLHTSGMVGDSSKIGASSAESFEQRQLVDKNRQHVSAYRNASVLHSYQQSAQVEIASSGSASDTSTADEHNHKKRHKRSQVFPRTSRIEHQQTSRVERPRSSRIDTPTTSTGSSVPPRASFQEPSARRYNPYA